MAHNEEILAAVLALWGTQHLVDGRVVPWSLLEDSLKVDLTGRSRHPSPVLFIEPQTDKVAHPAMWLDAVTELGVQRLGLLPKDAVDEKSQKIVLGGREVEDHMLHGFAGSGGLYLSASYGPRLMLFRTRIWLPPRTTLTARDVLAFIDAQPEAEVLREHMLWQDKHNLRITDGADWEAFTAALRPEHDEELVSAMHRCVWNTRFTQGEAEAWQALEDANKNPTCYWHFDFGYLGSIEGELPKPDVDAQRRRLALALRNIEAFARQASPEWAASFQEALGLLTAGAIPEWVDTYFGNCSMEDAALRLLAASLKADVFGGMGSWNDIVFDDKNLERRYHEVSSALFVELVPSLVASINSTVLRGAS